MVSGMWVSSEKYFELDLFHKHPQTHNDQNFFYISQSLGFQTVFQEILGFFESSLGITQLEDQ